jgi:phospholipase/lecithinase/hemolysin
MSETYTPTLRRWGRNLLLATGVLCAAAMAHAGPMFSNLVVFGDSLSDTGNTRNVVGANSGLIANLAGYGSNGRFSNGILWHETMADVIGESRATASRVAGANNWNYAYGGARVDNATGASAGVLRQYADYNTRVGSAGADPDALFVLWAGGNDARDLVGNASPLTGIGSSIAGLQGMIAGLIGQGATSFLVPNLPDLGKIPENRGTSRAASATTVSMLWNDALLDMLMGFSNQADIYFLDVFSVFNDVLDNPGSFGFTNTTGQCRSLGFLGLTENSCANANQWVFWDAIHPTTAAHAAIGRAAAQLLIDGITLHKVPEPSALLLAAAALLAMRRIGRRRATAPAA